MNIYIITGANGDIAMSMADIIREMDPSARLIGTDIQDKWPALSSFDEVEILPLASDDGYVAALEKLNDRHKPRFIIPTSEPELRSLARNSGKISGLPLLMNDPSLILSCMDKYDSMQWLKELGIAVPHTSLLNGATDKDLPLLVKPRYGAGSRGIEVVTTPDHLACAKSHRKDEAVAQQYLPAHDEEYTCAVLKLPGEARTFIMHRKMKGDITGEMHGVRHAGIEDILQKIAAALPDHTAINVQLRLTDDGPRIFEINPRFSSTVKMRHLLGFSDFQWLLEALEDRAVGACDPVYGRKVYRVYKEVVAE